MKGSLLDVRSPRVLLGGLSPQAFMRRHWQRTPLLVRQAWPGVRPPLVRADLFALAAQDAVESRLVQREGRTWSVRHGPFPRRTLPKLAQPGWTLLVQGLDLHAQAAHAMLDPFRFVPAARLDDLMVSWASPGGGVGPHMDSYDVFLLQVQGRRRWRIAPPGDGAIRKGLPLKILRRFEPLHDWVLEPGDMLYVPPRWGHDGVAVGGECMTCSVGFRAPSGPELAAALLQRIGENTVDASDAGGATTLYTDATQPATSGSGELPLALQRFAQRAMASALREPEALPRALGEMLSEPKPQVWFDAGTVPPRGAGVRLDRRTRLFYDAHHVFINGESCRVSGRDAHLLRRLADARGLTGRDAAQLSAAAWAEVRLWAASGWVHAEPPGPASAPRRDPTERSTR